MQLILLFAFISLKLYIGCLWSGCQIISWVLLIRLYTQVTWQWWPQDKNWIVRILLNIQREVLLILVLQKGCVDLRGRGFLLAVFCCVHRSEFKAWIWLLPSHMMSYGKSFIRIGTDCGFISTTTGRCLLALNPPIPTRNSRSKLLWRREMNVTVFLLQKCILVLSCSSCVVWSMLHLPSATN